MARFGVGDVGSVMWGRSCGGRSCGVGNVGSVMWGW